MIFIGPELSDADAHFVTNIVECVGTGDDLIIDLYRVGDKTKIFRLISDYLYSHDEHFVIYNAYEDEDFFISFKKKFPDLRLIIFFSDDEWRHANYNRYIALYAEIFTIAVKDHMVLYHEYGLKPFYMQWACNPAKFSFLAGTGEKKYDVTFIGAAYGKRITYVKYLIEKGVNIRVFGRGWRGRSDIRSHWGGVLSTKEMLGIISCSRINLNFLWTSADQRICDGQPSVRENRNSLPVLNEGQPNKKAKQVDPRFMIKGRSLELPACRAFQLCNYMADLDNYGFADGINIAVFRDKDDLLEKIDYYLSHGEEREAIAARAYEHVLQNHTWKQRFQELFGRLEKKQMATTKVRHKYRLMVLARNGVQHQISLDDERLDIRIVDQQSDWREALSYVEGVVQLRRDSSINNEALYMMAFGLVADKADLIASNFYVDAGNRGYWIRFSDSLIKRNWALLGMLPVECLMFSGAYAAEHGGELLPGADRLKASYIEYPSFWISLPYHQSRKLRLYFSHHRDARKRFRECMRSLSVGEALSLGVDKVWQRMLKNRVGE
ncbi:MAG TPA: hypothetical protein ENI67_06765 [Gammaproteobacteria bacterium]|mgnify:CR=1 FL=1|nr:hypothetical protein [Gammaproteobacteria bacterium]